MTFTHPWLLLLLLAPAAWLILQWPAYHRQSRGRALAFLFKTLSLAAILLALTEPVLTLPETKTAEVLLVDNSASITSQDLARASALARDIQSRKGRNWVKIVPFASHPRALQPSELNNGLHLEPASVSSANSTNLEAALAGSMAAVPNNYLPRFLLVSDGNENSGSAVRAIAQMRRLQVPVDTIALGGRSTQGLRLESASLPREAYSAEQIPIDLAVVSPDARAATLDIYAEGKPLGHRTIDLKAGPNSLRVDARVKAAGVVSVSGVLRTANGGRAQFEQAVKLRRARVLYLSQDPPAADSNLLGAFAEADFDVIRDPRELDRDLNAFQLVVLNNLDFGAFLPDRKVRLESYVKNGGGLLLIGGERQVFKEDKQMDALDRALPAKLAPPDTPKGTSVVLIIDKSSSMEGRKIELARLSAIGVVDHLRPIDSIGVLIFDNSFQWAVPMRRAEDKSLIKRLISGITPDGGTQIAPALAEAYRRVVPSNATSKHIVLLTDGISEEGDSLDLAREAAQHQVTISTVGLGQDVNRSYLEKVASTAGGRSYFLNEPMGLEQILLKDVETYSGSTAVEKSLTPIVAGKADVLEDVGIETAPALRGYARFTAKTGSQTLLQIDAARKDPLYVRWQYGLGRAAVFTSDAKSRWAEAWINWPGFDKFWTNVTRDLLMHTSPSEGTAEFDMADGDLVVHYRLASETPEPPSVPEIFALGPADFRQPIEVRKVATRLYQGRLHIGSASGLFRIRPVADSLAFPEIGLYRPQPELEDYGANETLLRTIASFTGGRFNPPVSAIFQPGNRSNSVDWPLWPACLAFAIALTVAELVTRKWSGLTDRFRRANTNRRV